MEPEMKSQYFYSNEFEKCKVVRHGTDIYGKPWYRVVCKTHDPKDQWMVFLSGTAEYLQLTKQDIEWAEKDKKSKSGS